MPLSANVSAGDDILASQYNNLRSDVLSTSQGHRHTGSSEDGRQLVNGSYSSQSITEDKLAAALVAKLSPKSIQRFSVSMNVFQGTDGTAVVSNTVNQAITPVNTSKTVVIVNGVRTPAQINHAISAGVLASARLTGDSNVAVVISMGSVGGNHNPSFTVDFEVLEYN